MKNPTIKVVLIYAILIFSYYLLVIQDTTFPFFGLDNSDLFQTEQTFFDFYNNFQFKDFLPKWNLLNDFTAYPYGGSNALQSWMIEMNLFYVLCKSTFQTQYGFGSIYYLLSISLSLFGSFFLLKKDFGYEKGAIVPIFFTLLNFYAINKYPGHFYYSILHWSLLSLCCDFIILKRVLFNEPISARVILLKILFSCLTIGLDIGYVLSFSITLSFCMIVSIILIILFQKRNLFKYLTQIITDFKNTFRVNIRFNISILVLLSGVLYLYGSLFFQLLNAVRLTGSAINGGIFPNINPLRIFLPYFPSFNPIILKHLFNENMQPDGIGEGSVGWFLLIIFFWSLSKFKKNHWVLLTPYFALLFLCYLHFAPPFFRPFLKIIPWHFYTRVAGRFTLFLPIIIGLIYLISPVKAQNSNRFFVLFCSIIGILEIYGFYNWRRTQIPIKPNTEFLTYMNYVKRQPGEAVMDFPFCVVGGNGVGSNDGLCPLYEKNSHVYAFQIYHEKKVIGKYNGRLNDKQIKPFLDAHWPEILEVKQQQSSEFLDDKKLNFLVEFFKQNDFAGINLYTDLISKASSKKIYEVFGQPTITTKVPGAGQVVFIPKKADWQKFENKLRGKELKFNCNCK